MWGRHGTYVGPARDICGAGTYRSMYGRRTCGARTYWGPAHMRGRHKCGAGNNVTPGHMLGRHKYGPLYGEKIENDKCNVRIDLSQRAITPGQFIVFYKKDVCLGGGIIDSVD